VVHGLQQLKLKPAAELLEPGVKETLRYYTFPRAPWRRVKTDNPLERILGEVRQRTPVVGAIPDGRSALMLVTGEVPGVSIHDEFYAEAATPCDDAALPRQAPEKSPTTVLLFVGMTV
jgi:hypothetical protein